MMVKLLKNGNVIFPGTKAWAEFSEDISPDVAHWSNSDSPNNCLLNTENNAYLVGDYCAARIFAIRTGQLHPRGYFHNHTVIQIRKDTYYARL